MYTLHSHVVETQIVSIQYIQRNKYANNCKVTKFYRYEYIFSMCRQFREIMTVYSAWRTVGVNACSDPRRAPDSFCQLNFSTASTSNHQQPTKNSYDYCDLDIY